MKKEKSKLKDFKSSLKNYLTQLVKDKQEMKERVSKGESIKEVADDLDITIVTPL